MSEMHSVPYPDPLASLLEAILKEENIRATKRKGEGKWKQLFKLRSKRGSKSNLF